MVLYILLTTPYFPTNVEGLFRFKFQVPPGSNNRRGGTN